MRQGLPTRNTNVAASDSAGGTPPAKNSKKLILIGAVVVLLVVAAVVVFLVMMNQRQQQDDESSKAAVVLVPTFLPLENLVVNLADPGGDRFIQLGITLELQDDKVAEQIKQFMPSIRDGILRLVSQHTAEQLLQREGKEQLAADIRKEVARPLGGAQRQPQRADEGEFDEFGEDPPRRRPSNPVRRVLFSSFIIQ
jgi:flagellar protein FliL